MKALLFLLLPLAAAAWEKTFTEDVPRAAQMLASVGEIAIGLELEGGKGRIEYFDYTGRRTVRKAAELEEWPLALRLHGSDLYALGRRHVWIVDLVEGNATKRARLPVRCFDFIVDRDKSLYCGGADGFFFLEHGHTQWAPLSREPVDGLALQGETIYILRGAKISKWEGKLALKEPPRRRAGGFRFLVRSSTGDWLTLDSKGVSRRIGGEWKRFFSLIETPTHLAYLYSMDPKGDRLLISLPGTRKLQTVPYAPTKK